MQMSLSEQTWDHKTPLLCLACNKTLAKQINLHGLISRAHAMKTYTYFDLKPSEYNRLEINSTDIKKVFQCLQDIRSMWNSQKDFYQFEGDNRLFIFGIMNSPIKSDQKQIYSLGIRDILVHNPKQTPSSIELARAMDSMDQLVPLASEDNFDMNTLMNRIANETN
jgi:hypothetical protein